MITVGKNRPKTNKNPCQPDILGVSYAAGGVEEESEEERGGQ
jgi:hypothetical protein